MDAEHASTNKRRPRGRILVTLDPYTSKPIKSEHSSNALKRNATFLISILEKIATDVPEAGERAAHPPDEEHRKPGSEMNRHQPRSVFFTQSPKMTTHARAFLSGAKPDFHQ